MSRGRISPEAAAAQFIYFVENVPGPKIETAFWEAEVGKIIGDPMMERFSGNPLYKGLPDFKNTLAEAYRKGGSSKMKAVFFECLFDRADPNRIASAPVLEEVIKFRPRNSTPGRKN